MQTEAWVLYNLKGKSGCPEGLQRECITLGDLQPDEVLVEPLYGSWEGNMGHALARKPIDIAHLRGEDRVVVGNSGVVRVLRPGSSVTNVREGDICVALGATWDEHGFMRYALAYDSPNTVGFLARRTKLPWRNLVKVPQDTRFHLSQWAVFSLRYMTAWSSWNVALPCFNAMRPKTAGFEPAVWGWGGGTTFAEMTLAKLSGFQTAMISASPERLRLIEDAGVTPIDRRLFSNLRYDEVRIAAEPAYAERYRQAEETFLGTVREHTGGYGVSIFVDQIGTEVTNATLKALARPGILATSGWKSGLKQKTNRAMAAMNWHTHVHTHYARLEDCGPAVAYGEEMGWMPPASDSICEWEDIPQLAADYEAGRISSYFPVFRVNPE